MLEWGHKEGGLVPILLDGERVATVDPSFWGERARLLIADQEWEFDKVHGDLVARPAGQKAPVLRAGKKGLFSSAWVIEGEGTTYEVSSEGFTGSTHRIMRDGTRVGTAGKGGFWTQRVTLDVDESVPPMHQLFLMWVSHIIRRRASQAASN